MRILIDAHMVGEKETGNETYVLNLVKGLLELETPDSFVLASAHPGLLRERLACHGEFEIVEVSAGPFRRLVLDMPRIIRHMRIGLAHFTYFAPPLCPCPFVLSIHDMAYKRNPRWFSPRDRIVLGAGIALSARRAAMAVAISSHARGEICDILGLDPNRVAVTPLAAGVRPVPKEALAGAPPPAGLKPGASYILTVGNLQPRKNLPRLVEALAMLKSSHRIPHVLVIAGAAKWRDAEIRSIAAAKGIEKDVLFAGYVEEADLPRLYGNADVFVYPSLYEGFGLPVLEAMACGAPVVASRASSIPEVAGDAAVLVNPEDAADIAAGIRSVLTDRDRRADLVRKGSARAASFSWRETARLTYEVYRKAVAG